MLFHDKSSWVVACFVKSEKHRYVRCRKSSHGHEHTTWREVIYVPEVLEACTHARARSLQQNHLTGKRAWVAER